MIFCIKQWQKDMRHKQFIIVPSAAYETSEIKAKLDSENSESNLRWVYDIILDNPYKKCNDLFVTTADKWSAQNGKKDILRCIGIKVSTGIQKCQA